jgi:hypothetical protein
VSQGSLEDPQKRAYHSYLWQLPHDGNGNAIPVLCSLQSRLLLIKRLPSLLVEKAQEKMRARGLAALS